MDWTEHLRGGSPLRFMDATNRHLAEHMILAHPPEPPPELLMNDPLDSVYIGRTRAMRSRSIGPSGT